MHIQLSAYSSLEQQLQEALKEVQLQRQQLKDREGEVRREGQQEVETRGTRERAVGSHERGRNQTANALPPSYPRSDPSSAVIASLCRMSVEED